MFISYLDFATFIFSILSIITILFKWKNFKGHDIKILLIVLLVFNSLYSLYLWLEWIGISKILEPVENFWGALLPMSWAFLFYAFFKQSLTDDLKKSEENYRITFHSIGDGVIVTDAMGKITNMNPAAEFLTGWVLEQARNHPLQEVFTIQNSKTGKTAINPVEKVLQTNQTVGLANHTELLRKDGKRFQIADYGAPLKSDNGIVRGAVLVFRDVTEESNLHNQIMENEERMNMAMTGANIGTWDWNIKTNEMVYSNRWIEMLEYEQSEFEPNLDIWKKLIHPDDLEEMMHRLQLNLSGQSDHYECEYRMLAQNGQWHWISDRGKVIRWSEEGKPLQAAGIYLDVTYNKKAEQLLLESEEKYRSLIENSPNGIFLIFNDTIEVINEKFLTIFNLDRDSLKGPNLNFTDMVVPADQKTVKSTIKDILSGKIKQKYLEFSCMDTQQNILNIEATFASVRYKASLAIQIIVRDITDKKKLETQLYQSQKMEAIGQLAGGIAHDFNNLLTVINGYSDLMTAMNLPENLKDPIREIKNAGNRAARLTSQLLAFSRKQLIQPKTINLNEILHEQIKMLSRLLGENIEIITYLAEDLENIKADPGQMDQVIMNLAVNARDAMPLGGKLTIETAVKTIDQEYEKDHMGFKPGTYVMLAISDTGTGMSKSVVQHIFEPFFTTKGRHKGTGLGLAMVYGIIKQNGGFIYVYSEQNVGTTFKIYFPMAQRPSGIQEEVNEKSDHLAGQETILVVEDDEAVRNITISNLEKYGYQVLSAENGREALEQYIDKIQQFDLVISDVIMPVMGGKELAEKIIKIKPAVKILFISGYTDNSIVHHDILKENVDFIQKPYTHIELAKKVRSLLND